MFDFQKIKFVRLHKHHLTNLCQNQNGCFVSMASKAP